MTAIFDDAAVLKHALGFEAALAKVEADFGVVTPLDAEKIAAVCQTLAPDPAELAAGAALAGTLAIPLVARIRAALGGSAALAVHRGATSQDLADTILALQIRDAVAVLKIDVERILDGLSALAMAHAATPAVGRTLLQDAQPISFGLRIAQWRCGVDDAASRLWSESRSAAQLQFGGAAGSRSGLSGCGRAIAEQLAEDLGLLAGPPWHGRRGRVASVGSALAVLIGALGKMARDVSLLSQNAIGEAREPAVPGRGGSSAMAHKRNPTACQIALSAALRAPGLASTLLAALPQEEERGLGGWQTEAPVLAELFLLAAGSAEAMASVAAGLEIDDQAIAANLAAANIGQDIGESESLVVELISGSR